MANRNYENVAYSLSQSPLTSMAKPPVISRRSPTTADTGYPIGQIWVEPKNTAGAAQNLSWILTSIINNVATWTSIVGGGGGAGVFTTLTSTSTTSLGTLGGLISLGSSTNPGNVIILAENSDAVSPTTTVTINKYVGCARFTGFTTAGGAGTETFTINNSLVTAGSGVIVSMVCEGDIAGAGALLELSFVVRSAGQMQIIVTNEGGGALAGTETIAISFMIIYP